jgi:uncharacterized caspase-like protein
LAWPLLGHRWLTSLLPLLLLLCVTAAAAAPAPPPTGRETTEARVALVIGNADYRVDPLDNPVNDARLVAQSLQQAGFKVTLRENLARTALVDTLRGFGNQLNENTIAVLYYAGHGLQLRDHNYLIPVDAEIRSEDEIPLAGVDLGFILGRMQHARSRINIVILDACRNNPFAGRNGPRAQGLAPLDAPVGTLLGFATAPGKLAADSGGGANANSAYARHLARQMVVPGLSVEQVFKRVREGVVRDTDGAQVPWESSSLQGEFAFVPGAAPVAVAATASAAEVEARAEVAFWQSIEGSRNADEFRAYLRQYPAGRFAALAQTRVAALAPTPVVPSVPTVTSAVLPPPASALPKPGDTWRYRVQDQFRLGDLFLTARADQVSDQGVAETWTTTSDAKVRTALAPLGPAFHALPGWTLTPPEFAPYLDVGRVHRGERMGDLSRRIEQATVPIVARVEGEEDVAVGAGRFRALKVVLKGQARMRGGAVETEQVVWYAPQARRMVKSTVTTTQAGNVLEQSTVELVEMRLN